MTVKRLDVVRRMAARQYLDTAIAMVAIVATTVDFRDAPNRSTPGIARILIAPMLGVLIGLPLAWRRRAPLASFATVLAVILGARVAHVMVAGSEGNGAGLVTPFLVLLVSAFSFGAYGRRRHNLAGTMVAVTGFLVSLLPTLLNAQPMDLGFWVSACVFWGLGRLFRERLLRVAELEDHSERLQEQQELLARAAVAEERSRIARELHDVVAHSVSLMVVQAGAARHTLDGTDAEMGEALGSIETVGRQALVELRRLLGVLRRANDGPSLEPIPGLDQIEALAHEVREAGLPVELHTEGQPVPLPPGVDLAAYRIVQEALTNSLKHAGPAHAKVVLRYRPHELELEVSDDGRPGNSNGGGTGHGLLGMRERVSIYGGILDAGPRPAGGFAVRARLPLEGNRS